MSAEDKLAIIELNHRYAYLIDTGEPARWAAEVFTEDCFFDERQFGFGLHEGRQQIASYGNELMATAEHVVHHMTNHVITVHSETDATGVAFCICEAQHAGGGPRLRFNVIYEDEYRKVDSAWLISRRVLVKTFEPEQVEPVSESAA
ncbi:nuclear transport factor 2 family protein [Nocardia vinacea]|uniref:nuclear transport factor 2 family protein n=1 Tax=Nocardia vinacea TaxID=96468 RepID=UPI002E12DE6F|nr:nuclear transport factor 2 family protein [Nocardia vinacea]